MLIRDAVEGDLPAIRDIMNYYRANTNHIWDRRPQTDAQMAEWLATHTRPPYAALVAVEEGKVVGYASLSRFRPHSGYDVTAEDSIYLAPGQAGRGIGLKLMNALLERAQANGLKVITAWIDSGNESSVRFHERCGFAHVGILKNVGRLEGQAVSVVIMQLELPKFVL